MLDQNTRIEANQLGEPFLLSDELLEIVQHRLRLHGYCMLRDFNSDLPQFSALISRLCTSVTFDPARQMSDDATQKVNAGTDAIGLHIENGNTPNVPELIGFYCRQAANDGSSTTLCDGIRLLNQMPQAWQSLFQSPMSVSRRLSDHLWKQYLINEHPGLDHINQVTPEHLQMMLEAIPGQKAELRADGSLDYTLEFKPIRHSHLNQHAAFANALLGPSINYETPVYRFADQSMLDDNFRNDISEMAEQHTVDIDWQNGDIVLIDNWRVMHGRRAIRDAAHRELFIGMGNLS